MRTKYHNRKVTKDGMVFDSVKEYRRWCELKLLEKAGDIYNLQRQVKYELIPKQYSKTERTKADRPRMIEREVSYIADFVYTDNASNEVVVEDAKGFKTEEYKIKRKLMLKVHGIRIKEV